MGKSSVGEKMKKLRLSFRARHNVEAYIFLIPFIIGALAFFLYPILLLVMLSFSKLTNIVGLQMDFTGFTNFQNALIGDVQFLPFLWKTLQDTLVKVPLTVVFSLMIAMLTNQPIRGRGVFRTIFFLPFLLGNGYVMQQLLDQDVSSRALSSASTLFLPPDVLAYLGNQVGELLASFFSVIIVIFWACGVQILLFLSGLQSISSSYYEAAHVEGANGWDCFWHITLPMLMPIVLLGIIYSLVDTFNNINNSVLGYIKTLSFTNLKFDYAAAVSLLYSLILLVIIGVVFLCMHKATHNTESQRRKKR